MTDKEATKIESYLLDREKPNYKIAEKVMEAVEKQIPKKPLYTKKEKGKKDTKYEIKEFYYCPNCKCVLFIQNHIEKQERYGHSVYRYPQGKRNRVCHECGQFCDWSDTYNDNNK